MTTIQLNCETCGAIFQRPVKRHHYNITRMGRKHVYCSSCGKPRKPKTTHACPVCCRVTTNPKYCSKSCSAIVGNTHSPKRSLRGRCADCGVIIRSSRKYCPSCLKVNHRTDYSQITLEVLFRKGSRNVYHTVIRQHAKQVATSLGLLSSCKVCGYDFYVECCHIRPVCSFPRCTSLSVVNAKENLVGLCPNHHAELDKGFLTSL